MLSQSDSAFHSNEMISHYEFASYENQFLQQNHFYEGMLEEFEEIFPDYPEDLDIIEEIIGTDKQKSP